MTVYILMVLSLAGSQTGKPVATVAFSEVQNCVGHSQAFNTMSIPHAYSWCVKKMPDGTTSPVVLTRASGDDQCSVADLAALARAELARRGVQVQQQPKPTGPRRAVQQ